MTYSRLSNKRRMNAVAYGEAVAKSHLQWYMDNPEDFPKNIDSFVCSVGRLAYAGVYMGCTWECSVEEQELAKKSAEDLVKFVLKFHRVASSRGQ